LHINITPEVGGMVPAYLEVQSLANRRWSKRAFKMKVREERRQEREQGNKRSTLNWITCPNFLISVSTSS